MTLNKIALGLALVALATGPSTAQNIATVSVDVHDLERLIPQDFEGFSIQFDHSIENYFRGSQSSPAHVLGGGSSPNQIFYRLIKNLGQGTLRTNSGLDSEPCWNSSAAPVPEACPWPVTDEVVKGYAMASAATGWGIIPEINLAQDSPDWALQFGISFANAVQSTPGSKLTGFEIGNEPDLYTKNFLFGRQHIRPPDYSWQDLVRDWKPYITAFRGNPVTENIPLIGPAYSGDWTTPHLGDFINGVGATNLSFVTVHDYPTDDCGGKPVTISDLLSDRRTDAYLADASEWVSAAKTRGLPLVLGESNSTACEGAKGVSDVFASTAWGLEWLFVNAQAGMRSVYFHLNNSYYSPVFVTTYSSPDDGEIQYANFVAPLYYAMYAFSNMAENKHLVPAHIETSASIRAYAVRSDQSGPVTVFVINKDLHASGTVLVHLSAAMGTGHLLEIDAPSLASRDISYGGVQFNNGTGMLSGETRESQVNSDNKGNYKIHLENASIAVLRIEP
jgi:hypothetical protein